MKQTHYYSYSPNAEVPTDNNASIKSKHAANAGTYKAKSFGHKVNLPQCIGIIAAVVLLLLGFAVTVSERLGGPLPTWDEIYRLAGLQTQQDLPPVLQASANKIHFIDVGQGDAVLLESNGHYALYDAGTQESAAQTVAYLRDAGVTSLDYLILSHAHADHVGGMQAVAEAFSVAQMILPDTERSMEVPSTASFTRLEKILLEKGIATRVANENDELLLGDAVIRVLSLGVQDAYDMNNTSLVCMFEAPGMYCLLTGDAEEPEEQLLVDSGVALKADVLKAGHHGSYTANTQVLLEKVAPSIAVISCGQDNLYGHPHDSALHRMQAVGAEIYRTDTMGTVVIYKDTSGALQVQTLGKAA